MEKEENFLFVQKVWFPEILAMHQQMPYADIQVAGSELTWLKTNKQKRKEKKERKGKKKNELEEKENLI